MGAVSGDAALWTLIDIVSLLLFPFFPPQSFDFIISGPFSHIICCISLMFIPVVSFVLQQLRPLLAEDGCLVVATW
jgi:hypothetical protein